MSEEELENDDSLDDVLAPMVDGLSGTVAVLLLVSVVFIIFSLGQTLQAFRTELFPRSKINFEDNSILFKGSLNLSYTDLALIKNDLNKKQNGKKIIFHGLVSNSTTKSTDKALVALVKLQKSLNLSNVALAMGDENECTEIKKDSHYNGCIYWSFK